MISLHRPNNIGADIHCAKDLAAAAMPFARHPREGGDPETSARCRGPTTMALLTLI